MSLEQRSKDKEGSSHRAGPRSRTSRSRRFSPRRRSPQRAAPGQPPGPPPATPVEPGAAVEASVTEAAAIFPEAIAPSAGIYEPSEPREETLSSPDPVEPEAIATETRPPEVVREHSSRYSSSQSQPAHRNTSSISKAIQEVNEIIRELGGVLDQMNDVLEFLEQAERDKSVDEREIENLRRQLWRIQRPREHFRQQQPQHFRQQSPPPNPQQ